MSLGPCTWLPWCTNAAEVTVERTRNSVTISEHVCDRHRPEAETGGYKVVDEKR